MQMAKNTKPTITSQKKYNLNQKSQSEEVYKQIVESALDVICLTDPNGKFLFANFHALEIFGCSMEELRNKTIFDLISSDHSDSVKSFFADQIQRKVESGYYEFPIESKAGKKYWFGHSVILIEDGKNIIGIQCISRDVTARKLVDQDSLPITTILDKTTEMVVITDKHGLIHYVNASFEKVTGYSRYEVVGKKINILSADTKSQEYIHNVWQEALSGKSWHGMVKNRKKDGTVYDEEMTITPVFDDFGKLVNIVEIKRDVTHEIKQREALQVAESRFKGIFENAMEGIYQTSVDGKLLMANKALLQMLGYESLQEFKSLDIAQSVYVDPQDRVAFQKIMDKDGRVIDYEIKLRRKDGAEIFVLENSRVVKDSDGNILYYEGIMQDITKRKESDQAIRSLNAQKDKFLSIISHDLRAPFNSILGFSEMLLDETNEFSPTERKEFLLYIKQAAEQQLNLVNNLLEWSRLETGRIRFEQTPVNLKDLISRTIVSLLGNAMRKQINLFANIPEQITVNIDESLTSQLFGNLLSNALKFTPQQGKVWVDFVEINEDFAKIAVRDTGVGIPPEDYNKLFRIDTKYYSRGTEGEEGSGLGLALCAEIVQKHGGKIEVQSELNKGTSFIFTLPVIRKSILVVDDNKGDRSLAILYVQQIHPDILILEAFDGYEAMSVALSRRPAIILADFAMPGMDGLRLLQELKRQPETQTIPVIIITSYESKADAATLQQYGVKEILIKPVNKDELQAAIQKYL
jgi:PAS domain S-box-containing protein